MCCVVCAGGGRGGSGVEVRRRATTRVSAPYGRPGTAYVSSRTLLPCCGLETPDCCHRHRPAVARPRASRMASHGHAVGPWRRAGVAVPHLALISLEAASRSSRRVKTVVSSHRSYDPRIDSICETLCRSHRPTWAAPHGIFNVPPYDRATSRISTSVQYVYRRAPPASARAPAEPQGRPRATRSAQACGGA